MILEQIENLQIEINNEIMSKESNRLVLTGRLGHTWDLQRGKVWLCPPF